MFRERGGPGEAFQVTARQAVEPQRPEAAWGGQGTKEGWLPLGVGAEGPWRVRGQGSAEPAFQGVR